MYKIRQILTISSTFFKGNVKRQVDKEMRKS